MRRRRQDEAGADNDKVVASNGADADSKAGSVVGPSPRRWLPNLSVSSKTGAHPLSQEQTLQTPTSDCHQLVTLASCSASSARPDRIRARIQACSTRSSNSSSRTRSCGGWGACGQPHVLAAPPSVHRWTHPGRRKSGPRPGDGLAPELDRIASDESGDAHQQCARRGACWTRRFGGRRVGRGWRRQSGRRWHGRCGRGLQTPPTKHDARRSPSRTTGDHVCTDCGPCRLAPSGARVRWAPRRCAMRAVCAGPRRSSARAAIPNMAAGAMMVQGGGMPPAGGVPGGVGMNVGMGNHMMPHGHGMAHGHPHPFNRAERRADAGDPDGAAGFHAGRASTCRA
ncbi:hypothetical protein L1887_49065 [Cichorium endivia]|nr:hypothetical protein L1887_49065 [Cichorium endivia]